MKRTCRYLSVTFVVATTALAQQTPANVAHPVQVINITAQRFRNVDGVPVANTEVPSFTVNDVDELQRAVGAGNDVALYTLGVALVRTRADTNRRGVQLVGGTAAIQAMRSLTMERGRFYTPEEGRSAAPVVVLSRAAANALALG